MLKIKPNKLNISSFKHICKAYIEGVYSDNPTNRKLGRVGMSYTAYNEYLQRVKEGEDVKIEDFKINDSLETNKALIKASLKSSFNGFTLNFEGGNKAIVDKDKNGYKALIIDKNYNILDEVSAPDKDKFSTLLNIYLHENDYKLSIPSKEIEVKDMKVLESTDTEKEYYPEGVKKDNIKAWFEDYLSNAKDGRDMSANTFHIITKDGKLLSYMGNDGNIDNKENNFKAPNWNQVVYIEHYGSDDHTFWYNKDANSEDIKKLTGYTLNGLN